MRRIPGALLTPLVLVFAVAAGAAAKPAVKSAAKLAAKPAAPAVQRAGGNGVFGKVYSSCQTGTLYFRLKSAEFTVDQVSVGETHYSPEADQKLLLLHFTIQNPQKVEQLVRWDSLNFTAVDAGNSNHEGGADWGDETASATGSRPSHNKVDMNLKPAQTIDVYTVVKVPAKGIIPKLMVLPGEDNGPILRYDLTKPENKVTPLKPPVADPSDPSGYTALETVPAALNAVCSGDCFDVTVQKFDYTTGKLDKEDPPEEGTRYLVATLLVKNDTPEKNQLRWDMLGPGLTSTDGGERNYEGMLLATADRSFDRNLNPGEEVTVRIYFTVPKDVTPKTLTLKEDNSRTYVFNVQ